MKMYHTGFLMLFVWLSSIQNMSVAQEQEFNQLLKLPWKEVFLDKGNQNWEERWFIDGQRADIKNMTDGMLYAAGPIEKDDASHAVLWTKQSFSGDIKIEYDFIRMDNINRFVNIIYIQATGKGEGPYTTDISEWSHLRIIPYMRVYYNNLNSWHISYAAFGNEDRKDKKDYVRARRYPVLPGKTFDDTRVGTSYEDTGLFIPGEKYHITFIKRRNSLFMKVEGGDMARHFNWDFTGHPSIEQGRIGLRHMWTRCSKYANFSVSALGDGE